MRLALDCVSETYIEKGKDRISSPTIGHLPSLNEGRKTRVLFGHLRS
mgnify:CR=1 FL=1